MDGEVCQCGFGEEFFTIENDQSICTVCGGRVTAAASEGGVQDAAPGGKRIIIVDDQPFFRKRIEEVLSGRGHDVMEAGEGIDAVRLLAEAREEAVRKPERKVSLVILDLTMPGLIDGFQTLGVIKAIEESLPVIILTSSPPTQELLQKLGRLKAKKYVNKASKNLEALLVKNLEDL
jgi:CheY-like chemotaxis protein